MRIIAATCLALSVLAAPVIAGHALAGDYTSGSLTIQNPWTRAMPPGSDVGGGFMIITNNGDEADTLVELKTPRAGRGEVHEMTMDEGVMKMRELENGLEIPPGATVELKPGSFHVMFMDVDEGFREGETIQGVLVFEKAGEVPIAFSVGPVGGKMAPDHMQGNQMKNSETQ